MRVKERTLVWILMQVFLRALQECDAEVVFPKRHHNTRAQNDLGTSNKNGVHDEYVTYEVKSKRALHVLDLKKSEKIHQGFIWLRSLENGKEVAVKHYPEHCYYAGKIRGIEDSNVFISTCSGGITGTIDDGKSRYDIIPQDNGIGHNYNNVDDLVQRTLKRLKKTDSKILDKKSFRKKRSVSVGPIELVDVEPQYLPYITKSETLYVEMFVSCDHRMLPTYKDNRSLLIERVLNAYSQVDKAYQAINIRIVVVAIDIQENQPSFTRFPNGGGDLGSFNNYVNNVIKKTSSFKNVDFDDAMFLSHEGWSESVIGMAWVDAMCGGYANSVNAWDYNSISGPTGVLSHEFGHNMGFGHDEGTCTCLTNRGCFMGGAESSRPGFSNCSMTKFKANFIDNKYLCLSDYPSAPMAKVCGNGIREGDEECDCGSLEMCKKNGDDCCEPNNCVLKASAQCSFVKNPECCQPSCLFRKQGTLCRGAASECDLPEFCEGDKATCPNDKTLRNGIPCGNFVKFCYNTVCNSTAEHGFEACPIVGGKECSGNGGCASDGTCVCNPGYTTTDNCEKKLNPINGIWTGWSVFTKCSQGCNAGTQKRYRFCSAPKYGGNDCAGASFEEKPCNTRSCPVAESCLAIRDLLVKQRQPLYDGVYTIKPTSSLTLNVYCDMTRDGGGWTLVVSSHSNTWDDKNVWLRNSDKPDLFNDYSIFKYANDLKTSYKIQDNIFNYRLEANAIGRWGGVFSAPANYNISSTDAKQTNVKVLQKFDDWEFGSNSIDQRLPYISGYTITTSKDVSTSYWNSWGSLTDNQPGLYPSKWIREDLKMSYPEHVWYWIREGTYSYPSSCLNLHFRSLSNSNKFKSGVYEIEPTSRKVVKTYCDFDRYGGGWTLLSNIVTKVWSLDKIKSSPSDQLFTADFSIAGLLENMKLKDRSEKSYQIMLEANSANSNGGIFSLPVKHNSLLCSKLYKPTLLTKFGTWNELVENIAKYSLCIVPNKGFVMAANSLDVGDSYGVIAGSGKFMTTLENPSFVRLWMREGGSRYSCNDLRVRGLVNGQAYNDGFYMLADNQPVYCDMTSTPNEAWTLLVTSASGGWTPAQVYSRNTDTPSLYNDFSILNKANTIKRLSNGETMKYMLEGTARKRWGGVWESSTAYLFNSTSCQSTKIIKQFDSWDNGSWWQNPYPCLPYLSTDTTHDGLLITSTADNGGVIISKNAKDLPAQWIFYENNDPEVIWYWLNENDCESNYKPIDGGLSPWSEWSSCSVFCGTGKQSSKRYCNSPLPKCGGKECDSLTLFREQACVGSCFTTQILSSGDIYCIEPEAGGCSVADNTKLVLRPVSTFCKNEASSFVFNPKTGSLLHKCSGKLVCSKDGIKYASPIVISSTCKESTLSSQIQRTMWKTNQIDSLCFDPNGGTLNNGVNLILWGGCKDNNKQMFLMPGIVTGSVSVSLFNNIANLAAIKTGKPATTGFVDNFDFPPYDITNSGIRMWTYFRAPQSGFFYFMVSCDDMCNLMFTKDLTNSNSATKIAGCSSWTSRYEWNRYSEQKSSAISLNVGVKYYLEINLINNGYIGHSAVGVVMPSGDVVAPISYEYLSAT